MQGALTRMAPSADYHVHLLGLYALPVEPFIEDKYPPQLVTANKLIASMNEFSVRLFFRQVFISGGPG
jgi:hypothetical protein